MPLTPIHMGPALAAKAIAPNKFSLLTFGLTQVVIDSEVAFHIVRGDWPIHQHLHTYLGATVVAIVTILLGRPLLERAISLWNRLVVPDRESILWIEPRIPLLAAVTGSVTGSYSQVLLDSVMHSDLRPFAPWSESNGLLGVMSAADLVMTCLALGALGAVALAIATIRRGRIP